MRDVIGHVNAGLGTWGLLGIDGLL